MGAYIGDWSFTLLPKNQETRALFCTVFQEKQTVDMQLKKIANMISNYDLANNTPMQGLSFIQDLKIKIQEIV